MIVMKLMEPPASSNLMERILLAPQQERLLRLIEAIRPSAGETTKLYASDEEFGLISSYATENRADAIVDELLGEASERDLGAILDRETGRAAGSLPGAEKTELRKDIARLILAALQNRYMENHVLTARKPEEIPFDPTLAVYYARGADDTFLSFRDPEVREQLNARMRAAFQKWFQNPREAEAAMAEWNNKLLHAVLSGDSRVAGVMPPPPAPPYYDA
jgi:hypothetical protein